MSRVHSFAFLSCGEPVSRAPILSDKYSRFAAASLCSRISLRICASAAANGPCSSPAAFAKTPKTPASTKKPQHTSTLIRRTLIRLPQGNSGFCFWFHHAAASSRGSDSVSWTCESPSAVSPWPAQLAALRQTRCGLAFRAEIAAASCDNHSPNRRATAVTALPFASICPMVPLIFSRLPLGVKKIGNRRPARQNRLPQNVLQDPPQHLRLLRAQLCSPPHGINLCPPQTFIRVNIADAAQHALIQQPRFNLRVPRTDSRCKFLSAHQQRIGAKRRPFITQ